MNKVTIDIDQGRAVLALLYQMIAPEFVVQCQPGHARPHREI